MVFESEAEQGISLRQAALVAGFGLLIMAVAAPFAEFFVYARLVVSGDTDATVHNMRANGGLLMAGIFSYLLVFICDVLVAWALYLLLIPVNRALSLLTAWFRLVYTAIALFALVKLATVYRLIHASDYLAEFGADQLHAQIALALKAFRYEWGIGLILFGIHLILLGFLVYRSGYIPKFLGVLLLIAGSAWVIYELGPYFYPGVDLGYLMIAFSMELVFMAWLLIRGWKIRI
ncbi:MAG: DUF4386 domain-containing protein [Gammaproteobacteria bacterium]|nr:DUF4386 domain-containing protein [Gammaproteobacteria bacterium]